MRALLLAESFPPNVDGGAVHAHTLSQGLAARGVPTRVVTRRDLSDWPRRERFGSVPVHRVGPDNRWRMPGRYLAMLASLPELLRVAPDEVVMVTSLRILGLPAAAAARLRGRACVLRADSCGEISGSYALDALPARGARRRLGRAFFAARNAVLERADAFVAMSEAIAAEYREAGVAADRIVSIPNGVDVRRFRPPDRATRRALRASRDYAEEATVFVYCGRLTREKGLDTLLEAWRLAEPAMPNARLVLVGTGRGLALDCEDALREAVRAHRLERSVHFAGVVDRVDRELACADVFVLPSRTEALGIALIEAMACGLPAIGTRVGGIPELIEPAESGLLVERDDARGLASALERLAGDRALRERMGRRGRERVEERFSSQAMVDAHVALFEALLAKRAEKRIG